MKEYKEIQKFNSPFFRALMFVALLGCLFAFFNPLSLTEQGISNLPALLIAPGLLMLFYIIYTGYLKTVIDQAGIIIEMKILFKFGRTIRWDEIEAIRSDKYRPILEFGGWGYRIGWKGVAYSCRGNDGLIILLKNGRKVVVGTQKPDELKKYLSDNGKGI